MTILIVLLLLLAIGPLAVRYGADSRLDERTDHDEEDEYEHEGHIHMIGI